VTRVRTEDQGNSRGVGWGKSPSRRVTGRRAGGSVRARHGLKDGRNEMASGQHPVITGGSHDTGTGDFAFVPDQMNLMQTKFMEVVVWLRLIAWLCEQKRA
jgi:hypothetical protein